MLPKQKFPPLFLTPTDRHGSNLGYINPFGDCKPCATLDNFDFPLDRIPRPNTYDIAKTELIERTIEDVNQLSFDEKIKSAIENNLKFEVSLTSDAEIESLKKLIETNSLHLKNIETISFVSPKNLIQVQELLNRIFDNQNLFSSFRKLSFERIIIDTNEELDIPGFSNLEEIVFKYILGRNLKLSHYPNLKSLSSELIVNDELDAKIARLKGVVAVELSNLKKIVLQDDMPIEIFIGFVDYHEKSSKLGDIEAIVVDSKCYQFQKLINFIHSKESLLTGLKRIEINGCVEVLPFEMPAFSNRINVVYFPERRGY